MPKKQDKLKRITIKLFSLTLLLAFALDFQAQNDKVIDKIIAVVGDNPVLLSELEQQKLQFESNGNDINDQVICDIYENLLYEKLLLNQAKIDSIEIAEKQVNAELDNRIRYFESQVGSIQKIEEIFGKPILQIREEFYSKIEDRLKIEQVQNQITQDVSVSPKEIRAFFNSIPKDSLPLVSTQVEVAHIVVRPEVSEEEKQRTKAQLKKWRDEIVKGEKSFATTAVFESDDPGSKSQGGEFEWVNRGEFVPEFDRVAFNMKEGEISEVFETEYGYHILELFERRGDRYRGRHILKTPKVSSEQLYEARSKCDSILELINSGKMTFSEAVDKFSDDENTKFSRGLIYDQYTTSSKFDLERLDKQLFLAIENMEPGEVKGPFVMRTQDGKQAYRLVKLVSRTEPHQASLEQDYQLISNMAKDNARGKKIEEWVNRELPRTFVKLSDEYKNCAFQFNWLSSNPN